MRRPLRRSARIAITIAAALCAICLLRAAPISAGDSARALSIGSLAPQFALPDLHGRMTKLIDYRGRVIVLNFWAFWCDTWRAEMPYLRQLSRAQTPYNFTLLAVSVDGTRLGEFERGTAGAPPLFPVLLDSNSAVTRAYGVAHVPTIVIIDRSGIVRYSVYGYPGNHAVLDEVRRLDSLPPVCRVGERSGS